MKAVSGDPSPLPANKAPKYLGADDGWDSLVILTPSGPADILISNCPNLYSRTSNTTPRDYTREKEIGNTSGFCSQRYLLASTLSSEEKTLTVLPIKSLI